MCIRDREFMLNIIIMKNLIIDSATDRVFFKIIAGNKSYTSDYPNSRENFDKLIIFLCSVNLTPILIHFFSIESFMTYFNSNKLD